VDVSFEEVRSLCVLVALYYFGEASRLRPGAEAVVAREYSGPFGISELGQWNSSCAIFDCVRQVLNRDVWTHPTITRCVRESFLLWQYDRNTVNGSKFVTRYSVKKFPHLQVGTSHVSLQFTGRRYWTPSRERR